MVVRGLTVTAVVILLVFLLLGRRWKNGFVTLAITGGVHDQHQGIGHGGPKSKGRVLVKVWR